MTEQNKQLAFVFAGQGSQSIGMLDELAMVHPEIEATFAEASAVLGFDLWQMVSKGEAEVLNQTHNTQPAMLAAGVALWRVWCKQSDVRPAFMAGHSLGEYTALVCSGALAFTDAVKLVADRGRFMQAAVPDGVGAMAAILGLSDEQVIEVCDQSAENEVCSAVNFNSVGQVVIAGNSGAVERAMLAAKAAGAKRVVKLAVSVPSHCVLMESAADKLYESMQALVFAEPETILLHNVDVMTHQSPDEIRLALKEQLFKPVRWVETVEKLSEQGVIRFVEMTPGKALMGLNKRIVKTAEHFTVFNSESLTKVLECYAND